MGQGGELRSNSDLLNESMEFIKTSVFFVDKFLSNFFFKGLFLIYSARSADLFLIYF